MLDNEAERLQEILLHGDAQAARTLAEEHSPQLLMIKNQILRSLTDRYREGSIPFCQLTAACQAAAAFYNPALPPVACCGAVSGNTSPTGRNFMEMLLHGWGMPTLDLGTDVSPETFLSAVQTHHLRFAVCVAFSNADLPVIRRLHELARHEGLRDRFALLMTGFNPDTAKEMIPVDYQEFGAAVVAGWMVDEWNR